MRTPDTDGRQGPDTDAETIDTATDPDTPSGAGREPEAGDVPEGWVSA